MISILISLCENWSRCLENAAAYIYNFKYEYTSNYIYTSICKIWLSQRIQGQQAKARDLCDGKMFKKLTFRQALRKIGALKRTKKQASKQTNKQTNKQTKQQANKTTQNKTKQNN